MFQIIAKIFEQFANVIIERNLIVAARIIDVFLVVNEFQYVFYDEMKNTKSSCIVNRELVFSKYQIALSINRKKKFVFDFRVENNKYSLSIEICFVFD